MAGGAAWSALTGTLESAVRGLTSVTLTVLSADDLQSQGRLVPTSLRPVLRTVAASVVAAVWSARRQLLPPGGGFSACKQLKGQGSGHTALEEELRVFAFV